ncbi:AAA family ATPase [Haliangium ochraceum]|uniref:ATPase AAA-type core domain-containing protein n=1 Tax=Haliangium ochraceum (strain DSM 14365 / JCM 11303 / SMP-2) TaxID=502025 RepID=D0LVC0_HALO1|nr:ATP-binding protein [Haliangium ochraceum]ACY17481.1 hypothetical protein Hoch_4992 [Haliangium ochraceum DSM 14365]
MRITAFWAKGFRSFDDMHLDGLGAFNIFYGPNGVGKSNILAAMKTLFGQLAWRSEAARGFRLIASPEPFDGSEQVVGARDRSHFRASGKLVLGRSDDDPVDGELWPKRRELLVEVTYDWFKNAVAVPILEVSQPGAAPNSPARMAFDLLLREQDDELVGRVQALVHAVAGRLFALIGADRVPRPELLSRQQNDIPAILAAGRLREGLFRASTHPEPSVRHRFKRLQALLAGPPLNRQPFELVHDAQSGAVELVESAFESPRTPAEVPLDLIGLGVTQIYSILGQILLRDARAVAIEDPEAHLHAPSTGMHLRQMLERLVAENYIDQLFLTTHTGLFNLDPDGYFDVSLGSRGTTQIARKPFSQLNGARYPTDEITIPGDL